VYKEIKEIKEIKGFRVTKEIRVMLDQTEFRAIKVTKEM
jgi:hypothetical protein